MTAGEPAPVTDDPDSTSTALVAEATRKAGLVWLIYGAVDSASGGRPAWHVWIDGAAYVVTGGQEQDLPGLATATEVNVVVPSKDTRARLVAWLGRAEVISPDSDAWPAATAALAAGRLNAEGGAAMIERWSRECIVVRITPTGLVLETAEDPSTRPLAAPPRSSPATTLGRQPRMVGGIRRRHR